MCQFKSMILLKDKVYCPDHDGHSQMLNELGIKDNLPVPNFVKLEITPPNGDVFAPLERWEYSVDQDQFPEWYIEAIDKPRAMDALRSWAAERIYIGVDNLVINKPGTYYLKDCKNVEASDSATVEASDSATVRAWGNATVRASGNATVEASDSATVRAWGNATVEAWDSATVEASDSATVEASGNATVRASGNATVRAWGNATVEASDSATVTNPANYQWFPWRKKDAIILSDNATFKDNEAKIIYQSGDWKLQIVEDSHES